MTMMVAITSRPPRPSWSSVALAFLLFTPIVQAFELNLFDRFRPTCPADLSSIRHFEPSLVEDCAEDHVWVAVYRSNNNKPSVLVRDEFLHAMRSATDTINSPSGADPSFLGSFSPTASAAAPVAVARLRPAEDSASCFVLDSMRCILIKEKTDTSCDGGSEHTEALATAIDALLHHYLVSIMDESIGFEGAIRTKATLMSAPLLEDRGFRPVQELQKDMVTHTSSLDDCFERFAARSVSSSSKSPGARQRAINIVSQLGRINRASDLERAQQLINQKDDEGEQYDPWAASRFF
jgi:hypothetical protein